MRRTLPFIIAACALANAAHAQAATSAPSPVGVWRGTSLCMVRPSACNDETVVFRISRLGAADSISIDGRRVVNGQEVEMGPLACQFAAASAQLTCTLPNGTWRFTVRGDSLVGELRSADGVKRRDVRTARAR
ncbi:MAG: hypothetical protein HY275_15705 [Gemmatimonadetes bacterium]|nr:hypothetical protein [Gemmatimonadota bacterium]